MPPKRFVPAALGGVFIGVLSALPLVNLGNLCCCLWVVGGGALAAYLRQQDQPAPISAGDGALVGLLAGLFGAVVATFVSIPVGMLLRPLQDRVVTGLLSARGDLPPGVRDMLEGMAAGQAGGGPFGGLFAMVVGSFLYLGFWLVIGSIFGTIGGVLGALFFARKPPVQVGHPDLQP